MGFFNKLIGSTSGNVQEVDVNNNAKVNLPTTASQAGFVKLTDSDSNKLKFSKEGRQAVGMDTLQFIEIVDGAVVNTNNWLQSQLTMTQAISAGFLTLNSGAITTINTYSIITSVNQIGMLPPYGNRISWYLKTPNIAQANAVMECGFGFVATTAAPTQSGAYFRWKSDGTFVAVANWSGSEVPSASLTMPTINVIHYFEINVNHDSATFYVDDVLVATILPSGFAIPFVPTHIPLFARVYTLGAIPSDPPQLFISLATSEQKDMNNNRLWSHTAAALYKGIHFSQVTTFLSTANHANSTSPTSATMSNTAAGYTTLGGRYQFAALGTLATDYALFGFQVPTGYRAYITGIKISCTNTGAAVATTATILDWSLGVNSSAVSLATADTPPTSWGPKRIPLGTRGFLLAAGIGTSVDDIVMNFDSPVICDSGRFIHVIVQQPLGTATAAQVLRGDVTFDGYFE